MIAILAVYVGFIAVYAGYEFLGRARWIDRVALVALVIVGVATRPSFDHHKAAATNSQVFSPQAPGVMTGPAARAAAASAVTTRLEYSDYYFFSLTLLGDGLFSVGVFGQVFVPGTFTSAGPGAASSPRAGNRRRPGEG